MVSEVSTVFKLGRMVSFITATRRCSGHILLMEILEASSGRGTLIRTQKEKKDAE